MRTILVDECATDRLYRLTDPDAPNEPQFEFSVVRALSCVYSDFRCIVFGGGFRYDDRVYKPDLALVANDFSHWFIIEVELVSHSLESHVLPQVKAFRYGSPEPDCTAILARELGVEIDRARTLLDHVPRSVAVVANKRDSRWDIALGAHNVQLLAVSSFRSIAGVDAVEVDGVLEVLEENLGFGLYSATDKSLRFSKLVKLPLGQIQINDPAGAVAPWTVSRDDHFSWVTKDTGTPDIPHGSYVQIVRAVGGRLSLRRPI